MHICPPIFLLTKPSITATAPTKHSIKSSVQNLFREPLVSATIFAKWLPSSQMATISLKQGQLCPLFISLLNRIDESAYIRRTRGLANQIGPNLQTSLSKLRACELVGLVSSAVVSLASALCVQNNNAYNRFVTNKIPKQRFHFLEVHPFPGEYDGSDSRGVF